MAISRSQMEEQIRGFAEGGISSLDPSTFLNPPDPDPFQLSPETQGAYDQIMEGYQPPAPAVDSSLSPYEQYEKDIRGIYANRTPITQSDIGARIQELSSLFGRPRRQMGLGDLALALSRGLVQQAQSGRPTSIGYGLALGFNIFNEAKNKRREEAEKIKQELALMAYSQLERERKEKMAIDQQLAQANLEILLKQMAQGGQFFPGKTERAAALNYILRAEKDPSLKETDEYRIARALVEQPRRSYQQTEQGLIEIQQPGLNLDRIFDRGPATATPDAPPIEGYTFTNQYKDGKPVYRNNATGALVVNE